MANKGDAGRVHLAAVGDLMFGRGLAACAASGSSQFYASAVERHFHNHDLVIGNLECPLSSRPALKTKGLCAPPAAIRHLRPFNLVSLANNHIGDGGPEAIRETVTALEAAGIAWVGLRSPDGGHSTAVLARRGLRVAFLGCVSRSLGLAAKIGDWIPSELEEASFHAAVAQASRLYDAVVVLVHGGEEHVGAPPPAFRARCEELLGDGAALVVTSHPHVLGGGYRASARGGVWFSLGDFIFDSAVPLRMQTGILSCELTCGTLAAWSFLPVLRSANGRVDAAEPAVAREILQRASTLERLFQVPDYERRYGRLLCRELANFQMRRLAWLWRSRGPVGMLLFAVSRMLLAPKRLARLVRVV